VEKVAVEKVVVIALIARVRPSQFALITYASGVAIIVNVLTRMLTLLTVILKPVNALQPHRLEAKKTLVIARLRLTLVMKMVSV
jgi:hypothetical protein